MGEPLNPPATPTLRTDGGGLLGALVKITALGLLLALCAVHVHDAVHFLSTGWDAIRYPFQLDFGEGVVANQTKVLMDGRAYQAMQAMPPYVVFNYPPLYHSITGYLAILSDDPLATGRAVSLTSSVLAGVILGLLTWQALAATSPAWRRLLVSLLSASSFLGMSYTASWGALMRVDMLGYMLTLAGLLAFVIGESRPWRVYVCGALFVAALYTKQTMLAAPVACVLTALVDDRRIAVRLAGVLTGLGGGLFLLLNWRTDGQFFFQIVTANANSYDWRRALAFYSDLKQRYLIEVAIAAVTSAGFVRTLISRGSPGSVADPARRRQACCRAVLGTYLFTAALVSLSVGKDGSEVNYLIELMGVVCVCVGVALGDSLAILDLPGGGGLESSFTALLLPSLLMIPNLGIIVWPATEWLEIPSAEQQRANAEAVDVVRSADSPVLSDDLTLLALGEKEIEFQPCDLLHLNQAGQWDSQPFTQLVQDRRYQLVILSFSMSDPNLRTFTDSAASALRENYRFDRRLGDYWLYRPKVDS